MNFVVRPAGKDDMNFITKAWLANGKSGYAYRSMRQSDYDKEMSEFIPELLHKLGWPVMALVVSDKDDPSHLVGFMVGELNDDDIPRTSVLHMLYVKHGWRKRGIATALLRAANPIEALVYTHDNLPMQRFLVKPAWRYNPFVAWDKA